MNSPLLQEIVINMLSLHILTILNTYDYSCAESYYAYLHNSMLFDCYFFQLQIFKNYIMEELSILNICALYRIDL